MKRKTLRARQGGRTVIDSHGKPVKQADEKTGDKPKVNKQQEKGDADKA